MADFTFLDPSGIEMIAFNTQHPTAGGEGHGGCRSHLPALLGAQASRTLLDDPRPPFAAFLAGDEEGASAPVAVLQTLRIQPIAMPAQNGLARRFGRRGLGKAGLGTGRKAHWALAEDAWLGVATVVALLVQIRPALGARLGSNRV
jgi:hypothetical protein